MQSDVTICRSQHIRNTTFDTSRKIKLKNKMLIDFAVLFTLNRIKIQWYVMNWHTFTGIAQSDLEIIFRVRWNVFRAWNTPYFLINGKLTWISSSRITKHTVLQCTILHTAYVLTNVTLFTLFVSYDNSNSTCKKCTIRTNICIDCMKLLLSGDFCKCIFWYKFTQINK